MDKEAQGGWNTQGLVSKEQAEEIKKASRKMFDSITPLQLVPKFEKPKDDFYFDEFGDFTDENAQCGWTLTGEMSMAGYWNPELLGTSVEVRDSYFHDFYTKNDWAFYKETKGGICRNANKRWRVLLDECFTDIEEGRYRVTIPTLFTIIEGELAEIYRTGDVGGRLLTLMEMKMEAQDSKASIIAIYSLVQTLRHQLFASRKFEDERNFLINRNWILHGRDDPTLWTLTDALRLVNVLSTVQLAKRYIRWLEEREKN